MTEETASRGPLTKAGAVESLHGTVTRSVLDSQAIADHTRRLANSLHRDALAMIEEKGADMNASEAQRVLRLFLLRSLLLDAADVRELASIGREIEMIFPPVKTGSGELKVAV